MKSVIFNDDEVRATIAGTKTQFRRVIKNLPKFLSEPRIDMNAFQDFGIVQFLDETANKITHHKCPFGSVGDRFFVKESYGQYKNGGAGEGKLLLYAADYPVGQRPGDIPLRKEDRNASNMLPSAIRWRSSVHMPEWAARLRPVIVEVKVERLNDISEADAIAEGVEPFEQAIGNPEPKAAFAKKWNKRFPKHPFSSNPYVWCVRYKKD